MGLSDIHETDGSWAQAATLHLLCGKIASGKSTLAEQLGRRPGSVVISEDRWLKTLFGDQMRTGADYLQYSEKLRAGMAPHIAALLQAGLHVVLDFAANTRDQRRWMRGIVDSSGAAHQLHYLDVPDSVCLARLRARNAEGTHAFAATEAQFQRFSLHFQAPTKDEGFAIVRHDGGATAASP